ncbi:MAG TPA: hypothetical protein VL261_14420 [Nitrospira sp.]|jgi:hypothetical protein|nr:hypothetical protein [Nitrospira sp.]
MPDRPCGSPEVSRPPTTGRVRSSLSFSLSFVMLWSLAGAAFAELRVVSSQGEYPMGDRDTRLDAMRLATEAAKRNALEQVATYLESVTIADGTDITKDEIRAYTAGLVYVLDQQTTMRLEGDTVVVTVHLTSQIDTEEVAQAILALRENESARQQLAALRGEIDGLHQELDTVNQLLATASTAEQAQQADLQRQNILDRVQSNAMVSQAWTDWVIAGPYGYPASWGGLPPLGLLNAAQSLYPANPHLDVAQQVIVMKPPAMHPHVLPPLTQPVLRPPGDRPARLTLNDISHMTTTAPVRLGNQPLGAVAALAQSAPSRIPAVGQHVPGPASNSPRSLQQFLLPPNTFTPPRAPSAARHLPPTMQQHLPSMLAPRGAYHHPPRGLGGHYGGTHGGYGGRGGGGHGGGRGR